MLIAIDRNSDRPLYEQLSDAIRTLVENGELHPGDRLPTVRALLSQTGLSDGTIRHAYELLAREGVIALIQGKGTFVLGEDAPVQKFSREARAMEAIDQMIGTLTDLGFTAREIQLFLNIKLTHREEDRPAISVSVVDCNSEALNEAALQLSDIPDIELTEYLLEDVRRSPVELLSGVSLVITTQTHYHELRALLGERADVVLRVALAPSEETVSEVAHLGSDIDVGIYCRTDRFAEIVEGGLRRMMHARSILVLKKGDTMPLCEFLRGKKALCVAPDYLAYAGSDEQLALRRFVLDGGKVISYHHQLDQGSRVAVEDRLRLLSERE
ncbi:MAG: GntR family transcriptional regulator [Clostridia bacterium]